jgi:hypothetical protein
MKENVGLLKSDKSFESFVFTVSASSPSEALASSLTQVRELQKHGEIGQASE